MARSGRRVLVVERETHVYLSGPPGHNDGARGRWGRAALAGVMLACGPARREVGVVIVDRAALFEDFTG